MSFYGASSQQSGPPSGGQRSSSVSAHNMQGAQTNPVDVLPSQLFSFTPSQLQFQPGTHNVSFQDPNNPQLQMQNLQLTAGAPQLLLQQQQQNFSNLNVNFLTDQIGVGQILQPAVSQSQSMSMQNLITPMSVALSGGMSFAQANNIQTQPALSTTQQSQQAKQRVFTGTVTKTHDNFGFIDEEVFFQMSVVKGVVLPKPGDRVLVEADFNPAMPFKWNATRVQIVNIGGLNSNLPNMNLNPGGKPPSPQPMATHGVQASTSMLSQHSSAASAANLLSMSFSHQSHVSQKNNQASPSSLASSQSVLSSGGCQGGQPQQGNSRYQPSSNPVSIVSNPHSAYGVRNSVRTTEDGSRAVIHGRAQRQRAPPPPPVPPSAPPPMVSMSSMSSMVDPHTMQQMQVPLPLGMPIQVPVQIPSLLQLERDREIDKLERERDIRDRERERERDRDRDRQERDREREKEHERRGRERERERSLEREKEREKEREREYEKKREREREREREKLKRSKDESKRDRDNKDREREKRETSPPLSRGVARNRSPIALLRDSRKKSRSRSKGRDKEKESRERSKSRSNSPKRTAVLTRAQPRYSWELPKIPLDMMDVSISELKRRHRNLYIPSDFILAKCSWQETFPIHQPMDLSHPCPIHIFRRHAEKGELAELSFKPKNTIDDIPCVLNPSDEKDSLKVKVILLSMPNKTTLYKKACGLAENSTDSALQHPNRLINFVVGTKMSKNETMLIGGSWSPSLDGLHPVTDPQVLINTAIRTTKALTGLDLRHCTKWFRFMELYYRRGNGTMETVIVFLPNIWAALPCRREWEDVMRSYRDVLGGDGKESKLEEKSVEACGVSEGSSSCTANCQRDESVTTTTVGTLATSPSLIQTALAAFTGENGEKSQSLPSPNLINSNDDHPNTSQSLSMVKMEAMLEESDVDEVDINAEKKEEDVDIYSDLPPNPHGSSSPIKVNTEQQENPSDKADKGSVGESEKSRNVVDTAENTKCESWDKEIRSIHSKETSSSSQVRSEIATSSGTAEEPEDTTSTVEEATISKEIEMTGNKVTNLEMEGSSMEEGKGTHFSLLDPKHMTVIKLREELELRGAATKGLKKNQLVTRLAKFLKTEECSTASTVRLEVDPEQEHDEGGNLVDTDAVSDPQLEQLNGPAPMETEEILVGVSLDHVDTYDQLISQTTVLATESTKSGCKVLAAGISEQLSDTSCGKTDTLTKPHYFHESHEKASDSLIKVRSSGVKKVGYTYQVPNVPEGVTAKARKLWERRYALPKHPHLLIHPSRDAKGGIFDCNQHSLNTLMDYRLADNKEQSFEVSLCSEFFHEMLQRDFAFRIYREIVYQSSCYDEKEGKVKSSLSASAEPAAKKRKVSTCSSVPGAGKLTSRTLDPHLLLAFVYFDQTRCGYITEGDLEDICLSLGIGLSRSQIRKQVQKVCSKGNLHYRKWTDAVVEESLVPPETGTRDDSSEDYLIQLCQGNKVILPTFGRPKENCFTMDFQDVVLQLENGESLRKETESLLAACESDLTVVDVKKLRDQLEKSEKERAWLESNVKLIQISLGDAKIRMGELKKSNESFKEELSRTKDSVKRFEEMESSALSEVEIFRKASERFIDRVKDLVKRPVPENKEKCSRLPKRIKADTKKEHSDVENSIRLSQDGSKI